MNDKPIVSEILPAGMAFASWLAEGDHARATPMVAFAAGWRARDAEVAAGDRVSAALGAYLSRGDASKERSALLWIELTLADNTYRAARRAGGGG